MSRERAKELNDEGIRLANLGNGEAGKEKLLVAIRAEPTCGVPWNNLGSSIGTKGTAPRRYGVFGKPSSSRPF